jgi:hypothetical protein
VASLAKEGIPVDHRAPRGSLPRAEAGHPSSRWSSLRCTAVRQRCLPQRCRPLARCYRRRDAGSLRSRLCSWCCRARATSLIEPSRVMAQAVWAVCTENLVRVDDVTGIA